ncbi:hypothetical protein A2U01_0110881, partial [Trifolium medium]|nr:hypothetical protein [Trifolium medium]
RSTEIPAVAAGNRNCTAPTLLVAARHLDGTLHRDPGGIPRDRLLWVQLAGSKWRMVPRSRFKWDLDLAG